MYSEGLAHSCEFSAIVEGRSRTFGAGRTLCAKVAPLVLVVPCVRRSHLWCWSYLVCEWVILLAKDGSQQG